MWCILLDVSSGDIHLASSSEPPCLCVVMSHVCTSCSPCSSGLCWRITLPPLWGVMKIVSVGFFFWVNFPPPCRKKRMAFVWML